jgi:cytochrome bd-type quinol oxidase subunit 2
MRVAAFVVGVLGSLVGLLQSAWWVFFALLIGTASAARGLEGGTLLDNEYLQLLLLTFVPMLVASVAGLVGLVLARQRSPRGLRVLGVSAVVATLAALLHTLLYPLWVPPPHPGLNYYLLVFAPGILLLIATALLGLAHRRSPHRVVP